MNTPTAYEVAIYRNGQVVRVVGYTQRRTKSVLLAYARDNGAELLAAMDESERDEEYRYEPNIGRVNFGKSGVGFTGYTKRDRENEQ